MKTCFESAVYGEPADAGTQNDRFSGDFVDRVTPVPIPNTEVKPVGADDTAAFSCGKVGSRRDYLREPVSLTVRRAFYCLSSSIVKRIVSQHISARLLSWSLEMMGALCLRKAFVRCAER